MVMPFLTFLGWVWGSWTPWTSDHEVVKLLYGMVQGFLFPLPYFLEHFVRVMLQPLFLKDGLSFNESSVFFQFNLFC